MTVSVSDRHRLRRRGPGSAGPAMRGNRPGRDGAARGELVRGAGGGTRGCGLDPRGGPGRTATGSCLPPGPARTRLSVPATSPAGTSRPAAPRRRPGSSGSASPARPGPAGPVRAARRPGSTAGRTAAVELGQAPRVGGVQDRLPDDRERLLSVHTATLGGAPAAQAPPRPGHQQPRRARKPGPSKPGYRTSAATSATKAK